MKETSLLKVKEEFLENLMKEYGIWFEDVARIKEGKMTKELYPYTNLFSPIRVNNITLKN